MKTKLAFLVMLFSSSLFAQPIHPTIINGTEVAAGDPIAQSTVLLLGEFPRSSFMCTGSIIAPDLIATAAHCLGPFNNAKITVFFGLDKNKPGVKIAVAKQMMANYDSNPTYDRNDIALLRLAQPIPSGYKPATLLPDTEVLQANQTLALAGYGVNVLSYPDSSDGGAGVLRSTEQTIIEPNYGTTEVLINIKNQGTCSGDSGGPAFVKKDGQIYLMGIASHMTDKDIVPGSKPVKYQCTDEIVYTNMIKQLEWYKWAEDEIRK